MRKVIVEIMQEYLLSKVVRSFFTKSHQQQGLPSEDYLLRKYRQLQKEKQSFSKLSRIHTQDGSRYLNLEQQLVDYLLEAKIVDLSDSAITLSCLISDTLYEVVANGQLIGLVFANASSISFYTSNTYLAYYKTSFQDEKVPTRSSIKQVVLDFLKKINVDFSYK